MKISFFSKAWQNGSGWSGNCELDTSAWEIDSVEEFRAISVGDLFGWYLKGCSAEDLAVYADDSDGDDLLVADIRDENGDVVAERKIWVSELATNIVGEWAV